MAAQQLWMWKAGGGTQGRALAVAMGRQMHHWMAELVSLQMVKFMPPRGGGGVSECKAYILLSPSWVPA